MLRVAADLKAAQEAATKEVCAARDRLDRLAKGDDVKGGLGKPIDLDEVLRKAGVTKKELRRWKQIALISDLGAGDELLNETIKSFRRAETATHRKVLKKTVIQAPRDGRLR